MQLSHEIEYFDSATGRLVCWVNATSLSHLANTTINMYYGNAGAANQQNKYDVWDNGYLAVYHLSNTSWLDSTAYRHDLSATAAPSVGASPLYKGANFSGITDLFHDTLLDSGADNLTVSYCFKVNNSVGERFHIFKQWGGGQYFDTATRYKDLQSLFDNQETNNLVTNSDFVTANRTYVHGFTLKSGSYIRAWLDQHSYINTSTTNTIPSGTQTNFLIGDYSPCILA